MLPRVLGDDLGAESAVQVDMLAGQLADVMVEKAGRLADENEVMPAVAVDFHLPEALILDFTSVGRGWVEMGLLGFVVDDQGPLGCIAPVVRRWVALRDFHAGDVGIHRPALLHSFQDQTYAIKRFAATRDGCNKRNHVRAPKKVWMA